MKSISTQKHTPGPWTVVKPQYENKKGVFASIYTNPATEKGFRTCEFDIRADGYQNSHAEANARLIAAAPDLLNMLQRMADETAGGFPPCLLTLEQARAAIAKAEGKERV